MVLNTMLKPGMTYVFTQWYFEVFGEKSPEMRVIFPRVIIALIIIGAALFIFFETNRRLLKTVSKTELIVWVVCEFTTFAMMNLEKTLWRIGGIIPDAGMYLCGICTIFLAPALILLAGMIIGWAGRFVRRIILTRKQRKE